MTDVSTPPSLRQLFTGFSRVGLSGFGGVLPWARRMLVEEERWLSAQEFNTLLGMCQFLPGPNVVNLAVCVGSRYHGGKGAWSAALGLMLGPFLIAMLLGLLYDLYGQLPQIQSVLRGVSLVGAGLLIATGWKMARNLKFPRITLPFTLLGFIGVAILRWPLPLVMLGLASLCIAWIYRTLQAQAARGETS